MASPETHPPQQQEQNCGTETAAGSQATEQSSAMITSQDNPPEPMSATDEQESTIKGPSSSAPTTERHLDVSEMATLGATFNPVLIMGHSSSAPSSSGPPRQAQTVRGQL